jgi:glycosyltransferase involved in cell wall biosynthesis
MCRTVMTVRNSWELRLDCLWQRVRRQFGRLSEFWRYAGRPAGTQPFCMVTCERNAGEHALRCLDSVYCQDYPAHGYRHIFIDDASTDDTVGLIEAWLADHPDHRVEFIRNPERVGGTANTLKGFAEAPTGSVVLELNGDDWLPDPGVLDFLNRVYADDEVWMTYNTLCYPDGRVPPWAKPYPRAIVHSNSYRGYPGWPSSHLHTFRRQLFDHLRPETFIDPATDTLWESADDQVIYLAMLELSGRHARHLNRVTYVYNFWEQSHSHNNPQGSEERALRIRQGEKYTPLASL